LRVRPTEDVVSLGVSEVIEETVGDIEVISEYE